MGMGCVECDLQLREPDGTGIDRLELQRIDATVSGDVSAGSGVWGILLQSICSVTCGVLSMYVSHDAEACPTATT